MAEISTYPMRNDFRSERVDFNRHREHVSKWKYTPPAYPEYLGFPAVSHKRPVSKNSRPMPSDIQSHLYGIVYKPVYTVCATEFSRRCADLECRDRTIPFHFDAEDVWPLEEGANQVMYSFDKAAGPAESLGLDDLIDKAEAKFWEKETDKIVKNEYEVLNDEGKVKKKRVREKDVEEDYETPNGEDVAEEYEVLDEEGEVVTKRGR